MTPSKTPVADKQSLVVCAVVLSFGVFLISASVQAPFATSAFASSYKPFKNDGPHAALQFHWFAKTWQYDDKKTEKQNLEDFEKWWCSDANGKALKNGSSRCNEPTHDMKAFMLFVKDNYLKIFGAKAAYILATDPDGLTGMDVVRKDKVTKDGIKNWFSSLYGKDGRTARVLARYEALSYNYDYGKTIDENAKAFQKWWCEGSSPPRHAGCKFTPEQLTQMMWFNNQFGYVYLMNHAVNPPAYKVTKVVIEGWISMGHQCVVEESERAC